MKLKNLNWTRAARWFAGTLLGLACAWLACAQGVTTTTVQGTVYLANGHPGAGTVLVSWPSFTTANGSLVAAGKTTATIAADGFLSINLAPNLGSTPAGLFYTAVFQMSDGSTSTQYWTVPAAAQAALAAVQSQLMPAVQAVQAVNRAYVDQAIQAISSSTLSPTGGTLTGPLYLSGDPTQSLQAVDKHYVDSSLSLALPLTGGTLTGPVTATQIGAAIQVDQMPGADFGAKLQACLAKISTNYGGTCDARNFSGALSMGASVTVSTANTTILLPCSTINTANQILIPARTRNVTLHGCALRGSSAASGTLGGTVFTYTGAAAMIQIGDPTYAADTQGFHLDNAVLNTTGSATATAQGLVAYRTQELDLQSLYFQGNSNQTGITLDGTGNYTGGTFYDNAFTGFLTAVNAIGHQVSNPATTDWLNASTFVRLHIDCPTSSGNPIAGTIGINLAQGDGNTFTGGDVEGCSTALHLGPNAQNNTVIGLRNENSTSQITADAGSAYNNWITGGTIFTGKLTDNGTRNSFLDTFHRAFNGINGDWYGSQQDATVTNHFRLGIGAGNERGLYNRYQTDSGYRWTIGLSDATAGEQFYQVLDELNNVYRLSIGQYNTGQSSTNNQTVVNAAGTGAVVLNGSNNSGTGGVLFGSGGPTETTVATISNTGNAQFNGTLQVAGPSTFTSSTTVRNAADAEIDAFLWAGLTAEQKESFIYKDHTGASQWYMVKDTSNNWALNSATGGLDSIKAYQSTNSGDTYINAANSTGHIRLNYETGSGAETDIYSGSSASLVAAFLGTTAIKFPGLAAASGHNCLQIDNSGYITNTGAACGSATGGSGTVNSGTAGQIAFYSAAGTAVSGTSAVPVTAGGTGATTAAAALTALNGASLTQTAAQSFASPVTAPTITASVNKVVLVTAAPYNAKCDGTTIDTTAIQAAFNAAAAAGASVEFPAGTCKTGPIDLSAGKTTTVPVSFFGQGQTVSTVLGLPGQDVFYYPDGQFIAGVVFSIHDLTIKVDNTVDASGAGGSFPNRITGTGGGTTALSPAIAPGPLEFFTNPGAGQFSGSIVLDAGTSTYDKFTMGSGVSPNLTALPSSMIVGQPLVIPSLGINATITAVIDANTVTFTPAYTAAASNLTGTMLNGLTPPWYIGNCGIAFPESTMSTTAPMQGILRNLFIGNGAGANLANHTCAILMQAQPYRGVFENIVIAGTYYGYVEAMPADESTWGGAYDWDADTETFRNINVNSLIPFVVYAGLHRTITGLNIYGTETPLALGPFFLATGRGSLPGDSTIDQLYFECFSPNSGEFARWTGPGWRVVGGSLSQCPSNGYINWLANESTVNANIGGYLKVSGINNTFENSELTDPSHYIDNGYGNYLDLESYRSNWSVSRKYSPAQYRDTMGKLDGSFLLSGSASTPYLNASDLVTTCQDWPFPMTANTGMPNCVSDPSGTEFSKSYSHSVSGTGYNNASNLNPNQAALWPVGTRFPQSKVYMIVQARCEGAASCTFGLSLQDATAATNLSGGCTVTASSSWTITGGPSSSSPCLFDLSQVPVGHVLGWWSGSPTGSPTAVDISMVALQPYPVDTIHEALTDPNMVVQLGIASHGLFMVGSTLSNGGYAAVADTTSPTGSYVTAMSGALLNAGSQSLTVGGNVQNLPSTISWTIQSPPVVTDTLAAAMATGDTSMTVSTAVTSAWASSGCFLVDQEVVCYSGTLTTGATAITITRGNYGTPVQAHSSGATLSSVVEGYIAEFCNGGSWFQQVTGIFTPTWTTFSGPVPLANCSNGQTLGLQTWLYNAPAGQIAKIAAVTITPNTVNFTSTTGSIGGSALTAGQCASGGAGIQGVTTSMVALASPVTYPGDGMTWSAYVSAAGTVTVKVCAEVAGTPTASAYNVRVLQ